jgi:hydroxymethylglutaryl-CoA synthase
MKGPGDGIWMRAIHAWIPRHALMHDDLATASGTDPDKFRLGLGCTSMAVLHPMQDPVTMAAEAGLGLLEGYGLDPGSIGQLVVATESGVDWAKPIASYVHEMLGLPARCRTYDVQHACFGASAALASAVGWIASGMAGGRSALVVATDVARYAEGSPGEATQGAGSVAILVGRAQGRGVLLPELGNEAVHAAQVMDFWRPGHMSTAVVNGKYSVRCYMAALAASYRLHRACGGPGPEALDYLLFHLPFPRMGEKAMRTLLEVEGAIARMVAPGLAASRVVGNIYSGSLYLALASLLESEGARCAGRRVGLFSYGSGCCAEFFAGTIGEDEGAWLGRTGLGGPGPGRETIDVDTYRAFRREGARLAAEGSFRLGHLPCADSLPPESRFVFLGYRNSKRVYAPGPGERRPAPGAAAGRVTRRARPPAGPAS